MTAAEREAKEAKPILKGLVEAVAPDEKTPIFVRPPRGPGPWFRVKHPMWGHKLLKAKTAEEAAKRYVQEFSPAQANDADWLKEFMKQARISKAYD